MRLLRTPPIIMVALFFAVTGLALSGARQQPVVYGQGHADEIFPFESLSDWASYAHQLSIVTVVGERELPPPDPPESHGGYVGRSVVLRIDETIWTAPGAEPVRGEIDSVVWGWMLKGSALRPVNFGSGPRLEVGHRYLMAMVPLEDGDWGQMTGSSVLPLEGDRVPEDFRTVHQAASQLVGLTTAEIVELLEAAPPDPIADSLRHLDPVQRVRTVLETRRDAIESGEPWTLPEVASPEPTPEPVDADPSSRTLQPDLPGHDRFEQAAASGGFDPYSTSTIFWVGPHETLDQMVREFDAIVIGTVKGPLREATEGAYAPAGKLQSPRETGVMDQGGTS